MGLKSTSTAVAHQPGIEDHLRRLDRHDAQQQQAQADDVEQLREAWQERIDQARGLLQALQASREAYGAAVDAISARDWTHIPPHPTNLNAVAAIQNTASELAQLWHSTMNSLSRVLAAYDALTINTVVTFRAQQAIYADLVMFAQHVPAAVEQLYHRLQYQIGTLTARLESPSTAETFMPLRRIPEPQPETPEVEMA